MIYEINCSVKEQSIIENERIYKMLCVFVSTLVILMKYMEFCFAKCKFSIMDEGNIRKMSNFVAHLPIVAVKLSKDDWTVGWSTTLWKKRNCMLCFDHLNLGNSNLNSRQKQRWRLRMCIYAVWVCWGYLYPYAHFRCVIIYFCVGIESVCSIEKAS